MGKFDQYNTPGQSLVFPIMEGTDADIVILLLHDHNSGDNHVELACPPSLMQQGVNILLEAAARMQETVNKIKT